MAVVSIHGGVEVHGVVVLVAEVSVVMGASVTVTVTSWVTVAVMTLRKQSSGSPTEVGSGRAVSD